MMDGLLLIALYIDGTSEGYYSTGPSSSWEICCTKSGLLKSRKLSKYTKFQ